MSEEVKDDLDKRLQRSVEGRKANSRGKLAGALLAKAMGAERESSGSNLFKIEGQPIRIHTTQNKTTFSLHPGTEPALAIVAVMEPAKPGQPHRCYLRGVRLEDCLKVARPAKSVKNQARVNVSLSDVKRMNFGNATIDPQLIEAETTMARIDMMGDIGKLSPEVLEGVITTETADLIRLWVLENSPKQAEANANAGA